MEEVRPWCGQPSDRGRLKNRTEENTGPSSVDKLGQLSRLPYAGRKLSTSYGQFRQHLKTHLFRA